MSRTVNRPATRRTAVRVRGKIKHTFRHLTQLRHTLTHDSPVVRNRILLPFLSSCRSATRFCDSQKSSDAQCRQLQCRRHAATRPNLWHLAVSNIGRQQTYLPFHQVNNWRHCVLQEGSDAALLHTAINQNNALWQNPPR